MKLWLIEISHNIDMLCNAVFWIIALIVWMGYAKSRSLSVGIHPKLVLVWSVSALGILLIPSKDALVQMLG
ncbi:MAG: hypothetical protein Q4B82_09070 [Alysiella sp.]|uniref:hypothetical protein n=1 Tax=Alysiella sp. TaxID=1872483 RepID=UPI0026DBE937|nr:hypothetical protein [Alysiella sp.]MDO4434712.1 hypothetical protein [Alysiella sp.]